MVAAWWAMAEGERLTCAKEESLCAGSDFSESERGRMTAPIRCGSTGFQLPTTESLGQQCPGEVGIIEKKIPTKNRLYLKARISLTVRLSPYFTSCPQVLSAISEGPEPDLRQF